jgi:hypothetical protein
MKSFVGVAGLALGGLIVLLYGVGIIAVATSFLTETVDLGATTTTDETTTTVLPAFAYITLYYVLKAFPGSYGLQLYSALGAIATLLGAAALAYVWKALHRLTS